MIKLLPNKHVMTVGFEGGLVFAVAVVVVVAVDVVVTTRTDTPRHLSK
jgi:hypothetical protein